MWAGTLSRAVTLIYLTLSQHFITIALGDPLGRQASSAVSVRAPLLTEGTIPRHEAQTLWGKLKSAVGKASKCPKPKHLKNGNACEWFTCKYEYHKSKLEKMKTKMEAEFKDQSAVAAWLTKRRGDKTAEDFMLSSMKTRSMYYKIFFYSVALHDRGCESKSLEKLLDWTKITFPERHECIEKVVGIHSKTHAICVEGFTHAFKTDMFLKCKNKKFYTKDKPPQMDEDENDSDNEEKQGEGVPAKQEEHVDQNGNATSLLERASINSYSKLEEDSLEGEESLEIERPFSSEKSVQNEEPIRTENSGRKGEPLHAAARAPLTRQYDDDSDDDYDPTNRKKLIGTAAVASGVVAGAVLTAASDAMWMSIYSVVFTAVQTSGEYALASAIAISVANAVFPAMIFLGLGILGASIAFLVCKYWPGNKRSGVRLRFSKRQHKIAHVEDASSLLD